MHKVGTMKRMALIFVAFLVPLLGAAAQGASPVITLQQSIDAALANGDDNRILTGNLDVARAQHALNVSRNSLTLAASAGYGQTWDFGAAALQKAVGSASASPTAGVTVAGPLTSVVLTSSPFVVTPPSPAPVPASSLVGVVVNQTIWNGYGGGTGQATVDKSLLTLQGKELAADAGRLALVYKIRQAYYTMLADQRNAALKGDVLAKQAAVLKQIQAIYDLKQASLVDLKTAQINARSAQVDVDSAAHDLQVAGAALAVLMGMPPDSAFTVAETDDPVIPAATLDAAVADGMKRRSEIKQLELSIKSGAIDTAVARGLATPTVIVSGGVNLDLQWATVPQSAYSITAGVKVSMPILDAGTAQNQADAATRQTAVYAVQETQLQKSIASDIRTAWDNVLVVRERRDLAQAQADLTALQLQIVQAQFDNGTASNQDLLTAAANDANARSVLGTAVSAVQLALLQLLNVMGY